MKELKSKKTGRVQVVSDEEFEQIRASKIMSRFTISDLKTKSVIPSLKMEVKKPKQIK